MDRTSYGGKLIESKMCEARMDYDYLKPKPKPEELPAQDLTPPVGFRYELMPQAKTYAKSVRALRKELKARPTAHPTFTLPDGKVVYRPLTFKETIKARLENYETRFNSDGSIRTLEGRLSSMLETNDTCTAIAYKAGTNKFKIIPQSSDLITIAPDFNEEFMDRVFDSLPGAILDSSKGNYNTKLSKADVLKHPAWIAAVEEDVSLLANYADIIFFLLESHYESDKGMGFWALHLPTIRDQLRSLDVNGLGDSSAFGNFGLYLSARFLRVAQGDSK